MIGIVLDIIIDFQGRGDELKRTRGKVFALYSTIIRLITDIVYGSLIPHTGCGPKFLPLK